MFVTRLSTLLPCFYSWRPEPLAEATDAFLQDWSLVHSYANPPWCLIQRCLKKTILQRATLVMITPLWRTQSWFLTILSLCIDYPRILPQTSIYYFPQPTREFHGMAWHISGNPSRTEEFQEKLRNSSSRPGETPLTKAMIQPGGSGKSGVIRNMSIPFLPL